MNTEFLIKFQIELKTLSDINKIQRYKQISVKKYIHFLQTGKYFIEHFNYV